MAAKQIGTMSPGELAGFFGQLAMLVRAGISSEEALRLLRDDAQSQPERELLDRCLLYTSGAWPFFAEAPRNAQFPAQAKEMPQSSPPMLRQAPYFPAPKVMTPG